MCLYIYILYMNQILLINMDSKIQKNDKKQTVFAPFHVTSIFFFDEGHLLTFLSTRLKSLLYF